MKTQKTIETKRIAHSTARSETLGSRPGSPIEGVPALGRSARGKRRLQAWRHGGDGDIAERDACGWRDGLPLLGEKLRLLRLKLIL